MYNHSKFSGRVKGIIIVKKTGAIFCKTFCWTLIVGFILCALLLVVPFVSFGKSYELVVADAAAFFGVSEDEYVVTFSDKVITSRGESVYGLVTMSTLESGDTMHNIQIKKSFSRPIVVASIFHEFAHVAQHKYDMDFGDHSQEQHAEALSFQVMWKNGYWWDALHLLPSHLLHAKSTDYRTLDVWRIAFGSVSI
jgi:hypothetical protein